MKLLDTAAFFVSHTVAATLYGIVFLAMPAVLAVVVLAAITAQCIISGGASGPISFAVVLGTGAVYAANIVGLAGLSFAVTSGLHLLRRRIEFSWWEPTALAFPVIAALCVPTGIAGLLPSLFAATAFCVYWLAFAGSSHVLRWVRGGFRKKGSTTDAPPSTPG